MADFRPFSPRWGDISFTEAPQTTARCYAGVIFLSYSPSGRHREPAGVEGAARHGAWPRCRWAAAGPGRASRRCAAPISTPGPTGLEGAGVSGGPGCGARGRWRGLAAAPVGGGGAWPRRRWAAAGPGRASRSATPSRRLACGDLAGGPPPTGTLSGQAHRTGSTAGGPPPTGTPSSPAQQAPGYAKGAGTEVPAPYRLTQPLPRRGSGRMILSPGDGDASTGTCRPRRPLPGPLRRSGRRSRCGRGSSSAWWPGRRARRNRSSRR